MPFFTDLLNINELTFQLETPLLLLILSNSSNDETKYIIAKDLLTAGADPNGSHIPLQPNQVPYRTILNESK